MSASFQQALGYLGYLFEAKTKHGIHSPFIYEFVTKVLNADTAHSDFEKIEQIRSEMLRSNAVILMEDYGAAANTEAGIHYKKRLSSIVNAAGKNSKYAKLLYRIIQYYQPAICLELGTNVGISAMYQSLALMDGAHLFTVEGSKALANIAQHNLEKMQIANTQIVTAKFDDVLPNMLTQLKRIDYAFIDGNHAKNATINYFEQLLPYCHQNTILVFDDINWSSGMQTAWHHIKDHQAVSVTVDLYFFGIVFFKPELSKQDFTVRF